VPRLRRNLSVGGTIHGDDTTGQFDALLTVDPEAELGAGMSKVCNAADDKCSKYISLSLYCICWCHSFVSNQRRDRNRPCKYRCREGCNLEECGCKAS
jgi:hypothetical protein